MKPLIKKMQQSIIVRKRGHDPLTPFADVHKAFNDCFSLRQSQLRQAVVEVVGEGAPVFSAKIELVVEVRVSPPRLEERLEITLSVLRPTGVLSLLRSRDVTCS